MGETTHSFRKETNIKHINNFKQRRYKKLLNIVIKGKCNHVLAIYLRDMASTYWALIAQNRNEVARN